MQKQIPFEAAAQGLPPGTRERLTQFVERTDLVGPLRLIDEDGAPSTELLNFAERTGLSLDWLFRGEVRGLVIQSRNAARKHI